jgi:hypothetical protein
MDDDWLVDEQELTPDNYQQYVSDREWNSLKNEFVKVINISNYFEYQ